MKFSCVAHIPTIRILDGCCGRICCAHFLMGNKMKGAVFFSLSLLFGSLHSIDSFNLPYSMCIVAQFCWQNNNNKLKENNVKRNSNLRKVNNNKIVIVDNTCSPQLGCFVCTF